MRSERMKRIIVLVVAAAVAFSARADDGAGTASKEQKQVALDACSNLLLTELSVSGTADIVLLPGKHANGVADAVVRQLAWYREEPRWSTKFAPAIRKVCECYIPPIVADLGRDSRSQSDLVMRVRARMLGIYDEPQDKRERARYESCYAPLLEARESRVE